MGNGQSIGRIYKAMIELQPVRTTERELKKLMAEASYNWLQELNEHDEHWNEIEDGYKYLGGDQISKKQKEWYDTLRRPTRPFNLIIPSFNQTLGDFLINDQKQKVYPLTGNKGQASTIQMLFDQNNIDNDIETVYSMWGIAGLVKMGFVMADWNDDRHPDGSLVVKGVNEYNVMFDTRSEDYFHDDGWYQYRSKWMTADQILSSVSRSKKREIEGAIKDRKQEGYWQSMSNVTVGGITVRDLMKNPQLVDEDRGQFRVVEYRYMELEDADVFVRFDGGSEIVQLDDRRRRLFERLNKGQGIMMERKVRVKKILTYIPGLMTDLDHYFSDLQDQTHDIIPFCGYPYAKRAIDHFSVFRNAKGPQDDFNDHKNLSNDIVAKMANPGAKMKGEFIENLKDVQNHAGETGLEVWLTDDAPKDAYELLQYSGLPTGHNMLQNEAAVFLQKIMQVTANLSGESESANEPNSLFVNRVKRALAGFRIIYKGWAASKRRLGQKRIRLMQQHMEEPDIVRVTVGNTVDDPKELEINTNPFNSLNPGRFDMTVQDIDNHPTAKYAKFRERQEVVGLVANLWGPAAVDPDFALEEAPVEGIEKQIERIKQVAAVQAEQAGQQEALATTDAMLDMAGKKLAMEKDEEPQLNVNTGGGKK
jgi:hypothetical protein